MLITKRNLLLGLVSSLAAPAIVQAQSLMPIYNGLIVMGKGNYSVTGMTVSGRIIQEYVEAHEWTKTCWAEIAGVVGWFERPHELPGDIDLVNSVLRNRSMVRQEWSEDRWRGQPVYVTSGRSWPHFPLAPKT